MPTGFDIKWFDELESTNDEAAKPIYGGDKMSVIAALKQTRGRGQQGNRWHARPGENLTFSLVLHPGILSPEQFFLSGMTALVLCRYFTEKGLETHIKWPNDIYAGDRKICGVLIENRLRGAGVERSIIGVGVNLNQEVFPPDLPNPTSLLLETGQRTELKAELERLARLFTEAWDTLPHTVEGCRGAYDALRYRREGEWTFEDLRGTGRAARPVAEIQRQIPPEQRRLFRARILGITPQGRLRLSLADGKEETFAFKEVAYIL